MIIECMTDNRNHTAPDMRSLFRDGQFGAKVMFFFDHDGIVEATHDTPGLDRETTAIEAGAQDVEPLVEADENVTWLGAWLTQEKISLGLFVLAALAGLFAVVPATLNAYWLGKHLQRRMLGLALLASAILLLIAAGAWQGLALGSLSLLQCLALLLFAGATWRYLRKLAGGGEGGDREHYRKLVSFVPVGLAIGIMSPVSLLVVRGLLSGMLSWNDVGLMQALWRSAEWVTATAAGVMSLIFLPRLSASHGSAQFNRELVRAGVIVLAAAAILLLGIYFNQRAMLATLYDTRFTVSDEAAALIMLGSWVRVASWLFLFGLFAASRTRLIVAGEVLSLPLFALLLWLLDEGMTLERASLLYLASFIVYLSFNAAALYWPHYALLGKAWFHTTEEKRGKPLWDTVVFDMPASGHSVSMLRIPWVIIDTVPEGPLTRDARTVKELLCDPASTATVLVTLAEEMPVNEAVELEAKLSSLGIVPQQIVCNQVYPSHFPPGQPVTRVLAALEADPALPSPLRELTEHATLSRDRRALNERYLAELRSRTKSPVLELPMLFTPSLEAAHGRALGQHLER